MKKALPAIIPILFLIFLIPTTTVSANDGNGPKTASPAASTFGFPHHAPPPTGFTREHSWLDNLWDKLMELFGRNKEHGGGGQSSGAPVGSFPDPTPAGSGSNAPAAPLDGGISLLLAAGIGLGVKKAMDRYKNIHPQTRNEG